MSTPAPVSGTSAFAPSLPGIVLGAALQLQQTSLWALQAYVACTAASAMLLVLVWLLARRLRFRAVMIFATACVLSASATGWRAAAYAGSGLDASLEGRDLVLTGIVAALPHRGEAGIRFRFEPESARLAGDEVRVPPQLLLGWYGGPESGAEGILSPQRQPADLRPGERWRFNARLKAPHGQVNPHGFDYELWLWEQGVQATGSIRAGPRDPPPQRLGASWRHPMEQARHRVRAAIESRVTDPRLAGVLAALVVGDQGAIERADWDVFRATGVAHLMSISGLHVTMFAWLAAACVMRLWRLSARLCLAWPAQHAGVAGGVLLASAYALFSGWGVPAQRTVLMLATVGALRLGARSWPWPWLWLAACAVVVACDPWALTQAGFWLSFVAVGVLFASGPGREAAPATKGRRLANRFTEGVRGLVREQAIVTVALTPLSLLLFGQVSLVGLLANLVAIPWVTLVVTPLGLAGVAFAPLWALAAATVELLAVLLRWLAEWPLATWSAPAPPIWAAAVGVAGGMLLAMRLPWATRLLGVPLMVPVLLWHPARPVHGEFELLAADVGQGNAVLVRTAGHTLVYDAGPLYSRETDAGQRVLVPLLRALDERVDMLMLSHRDADHTGGAVAVLRMQSQARLVSSLEASHPLRALRPVERCVAGQAWEWDGVRFEILHPQPEAYAAPARPNALSCVLRVGNGRVHALLAGDIERPQEASLSEAPASIQADWLLVPHHGSRTSSSAGFLDAVRPAIALAQAGYRNRFGHPAPDVVQRYVERGIALSVSPACGALTWRSALPSVVRCERDAAPHYWHHGVAAAARNGA
jgi:competence protein ComEC